MIYMIMVTVAIGGNGTDYNYEKSFYDSIDENANDHRSNYINGNKFSY